MGTQFARRSIVAGLGLGITLVAAPPKPCAAQERPLDREPIIVIGDRIVDGLDGVAPIDRITAQHIQGYGDDTLADLLADLSREAQAQDEGSRPLILLNGKRVSSSREIGDLPTESIARVEVYPAPAAQRFGGSAGQKVMNFVLRDRHRSATVNMAGPVRSAGGGGQTGNAGVSLARVRGENRSSFALRAAGTRRLLESERGIRSIAGVDGIDETRFRTLTPAQHRYVLNAVLARQLSKMFNLSVNAGGDAERLRRLNGLQDGPGLSVDPRPLKQDVRAKGAFLAAKASADVGKWDLTGITEVGARRTKTTTELPSQPSVADRTTERARSSSDTARAAIEGSGPLFKLPAGDVRLSVNTDLTRSTLDARVRRSDFSAEGRRKRTDAGAWLDTSIPITRAAEKAGGPFRGISAQLGAGVRSVSDMRTLHSFSGGINWAPIAAINFNAAAKTDQQPPTLEQLASPRIETSGVPFFDYLTGRTVEVAQVSGGNPSLGRDRRRTLSLALNFLPFGPGPLRVSADYKHVRIHDPIAGLPAATASIQATFAERFIRDATGTLVRVDTRPLNLAREQRNQLHWGFVTRYPWGAGPLRQGDEGSAETGDRLNLRMSLDHVWVFRDRILLRRGFPLLDLLNGSASGDFGGQPRHLLQWDLGAYRRGLGTRLTGRWQSGTTVHDGATGGSAFLRFSPLMQHDFRLFAELGKQLPEERWARDLRLSLIVANLLNSHLKVHDSSGVTPLRYQAGYVDPLGRTITVELRKQLS